jgi:hypothetical protein
MNSACGVVPNQKNVPLAHHGSCPALPFLPFFLFLFFKLENLRFSFPPPDFPFLPLSVGLFLHFYIKTLGNMSNWQEEFFGHHLLTKDGIKPVGQVLDGKKLIGVYFSAHWVS